MTQATNTRSDSRGGIGSKNKSQDKNYKMKAEFKAMFFLFFFFNAWDWQYRALLNFFKLSCA